MDHDKNKITEKMAIKTSQIVHDLVDDGFSTKEIYAIVSSIGMTILTNECKDLDHAMRLLDAIYKTNVDHVKKEFEK